MLMLFPIHILLISHFKMADLGEIRQRCSYSKEKQNNEPADTSCYIYMTYASIFCDMQCDHYCALPPRMMCFMLNVCSAFK